MKRSFMSRTTKRDILPGFGVIKTLTKPAGGLRRAERV
jgi:hypothetical protein